MSGYGDIRRRMKYGTGEPSRSPARMSLRRQRDYMSYKSATEPTRTRTHFEREGCDPPEWVGPTGE